MLRVFIGYDERQAVAYNVCRYSIERRASVPVAITPLKLDTLPLKREGLTRFTFSRFLVPWLCGYEGWALFMDSDFAFFCDVNEIFDCADDRYAAMVVKNKERFEWASLILFNCGHEANRVLTPAFVENLEGRRVNLHSLGWLTSDQIGSLPLEYNYLAGYSEPRNAKVVHWTQGMPIFPETEGSPYTEEWKAEHRAMNSTQPWLETMAHSVHAAMTRDGRRVAKLHRDAIIEGKVSAMDGT
jgi:hypothetical protein